MEKEIIVIQHIQARVNKKGGYNMKKLITALSAVAVVICITLVCLINTAMTTQVKENETAYTDTQATTELTSNSAGEETEIAQTEEVYSGKTISLEKQAGDTTITNSAGKVLDLRDSSKMYNGYQLSTSEGYIWIALDDNGVLKMDMDTEIKIEKNGDNLEILLVEGEVFFNISESFEEGETFTIRTSTMTTGIRGTSGIISTATLDNMDTEFSIKLLEGQVELTYLVDNATDTHLADELQAGQQFTLNNEEDDEETDDVNEEELLISKLTDLEADDINGFVAVEIKDSVELQEKILASDSLIDEDMLNEIVQNADDKLAEDQENRQILIEALEALQLETQEKLEALASQLLTEDELEELTNQIETSTSSEGEVTVSFYYYKSGETSVSLFTTQIIEENSIPAKPFLQPSVNGGWYYISSNSYSEYKFNIQLDSDISLIWISK